MYRNIAGHTKKVTANVLTLMLWATGVSLQLQTREFCNYELPWANKIPEHPRHSGL